MRQGGQGPGSPAHADWETLVRPYEAWPATAPQICVGESPLVRSFPAAPQALVRLEDGAGVRLLDATPRQRRHQQQAAPGGAPAAASFLRRAYEQLCGRDAALRVGTAGMGGFELLERCCQRRAAR